MRLVESNRRSEIKLNANGGNSILMVCDPIREMEYVAHLQELLPSETYSIIDLNKCLIEFVSSHKEELVELYDLLQASTHEIFKAPADEESQDLFKNVQPVLHHQGARRHRHRPCRDAQDHRRTWWHHSLRHRGWRWHHIYHRTARLSIWCEESHSILPPPCNFRACSYS